MKVFKYILYTCVGIVFGAIGALCIIPFIALFYLINLPCLIVSDIWRNLKNE